MENTYIIEYDFWYFAGSKYGWMCQRKTMEIKKTDLKAPYEYINNKKLTQGP